MIELKKLARFSLAVFLIVAACSIFSPQGSDPDGDRIGIPLDVTEAPLAVVTEAVLETEEPASLPTEVPTASPASQEELIETFRPALGIYSLLYGICDASLQSFNNAETDSAYQLGEIIGYEIFLTAAEEGLSGWAPTGSLEGYDLDAQDRVGAMRGVISGWSDEEITPAEASSQMESECEAISTALEEITVAASAEGLTSESLEAIGEEMQEEFADLYSGFVPEETGEPALSTELGFSRANPVPVGDTFSAPDWDIQVLEVQRGEAAWAALQAENSFNDPPPDGEEYVLIKIKAACTAEDAEEHTIGSWDFGLTGSRLVEYSPASAVYPEPALDSALYSGGESEGWVAFAVAQEEDNLILVFDELANWDDERFRFFAADASAAIAVDESLAEIQPSGLGVDRSEPAPLGETVVTEDWVITVLEVVRGEEAWGRLQEAYEYNEPPGDGMEYLLVRVRTRYIGVSDRSAGVDKYSFTSTGSENAVYDPPSTFDPEPSVDAYLFSGGESEGWLTLLAAEGETGMMAVFAPWADWDDENQRFLALE